MFLGSLKRKEKENTKEPCRDDRREASACPLSSPPLFGKAENSLKVMVIIAVGVLVRVESG